ncbi:MAG: hypothetical protein L0Y39_10840 [Methylococcaceae bacterium]|nr:hypothetical protein [Methylococcaceae bacterium]
MKIEQFNYLSSILKFSALAALVCSSTANAQPYECMHVQARPVKESFKEEELKGGTFPVDEVIIDGVNFGSNPKVYFGARLEPVEVLSVGRNNNLDSITLKLPAGTVAGTYKLIIQNRTGPFLDNDGGLNPIFCFGSVRIGIVMERSSSITSPAYRRRAD